MQLASSPGVQCTLIRILRTKKLDFLGALFFFNRTVTTKCLSSMQSGANWKKKKNSLVDIY